MSHTNRVVLLIDMDCFYCQVEEQLDSNLKGKPIAVVQYNAWKGGGIIAVNYAARDRGVTRHMRGDEAKEKCPDIELPRVPQVRGKADLTKYREAGKRVAEVLKTFTKLLERASVDEAYLDITETVKTHIEENRKKVNIEDLKSTFVVGSETEDFLHNVYTNVGFCESDLKLLIGAAVAEQIRAAVFEQTGYQCSAGIAHNKILAKLVCGLNKPNKQTVLPQLAVPELFANLPIRKIKSLGGKFGNTLSEVLQIQNVGELAKFSEKELVKHFDEKTGSWLYNIARGIDREPVEIKLISKSIACCKKFAGKAALLNSESIQHWLTELSLEIAERLAQDLEENSRKAKQMTVSFAQITNKEEINSTRTTLLPSYDAPKICQAAFEVLKKFCQKPDGSFHVTYLGVSVGNFENTKNVRSIASFFEKAKPSEENLKSIEKKCEHKKETVDKRKTLDSYFKSLEHSSEIEINTPALVEEHMEKTKESADENMSVYSVSTEELEENIENYVFYKDDFKEEYETTKNLVNEKRLTSPMSQSENSLDNEIFLENNVQDENRGNHSGSSFFVRYFENLHTKSPCDRNFDTSKILGDIDSSTASTSMSAEESVADTNVSSVCEDINAELNSEPTTECTECHKSIPVLEMVSHMDYHYALSIVKDESSLYKTTSKKEDKVEPTEKKSSKRKAGESEKNTLLPFFKKENSSMVEENTEVCSECNKRIKLIEFDSHIDYHAAKRLHLELNSLTFDSSKGKVNTPNSKKSDKNIANKPKVKSVSSYFKQLQTKNP